MPQTNMMYTKIKALLGVWVLTCVQVCGFQFYSSHQTVGQLYGSHQPAAILTSKFKYRITWSN